MKLFFLATTLFITSLVSFGQSKSDKIIGTWVNDNKDAHVEFFKHEGKYYGKITWLEDPLGPDGAPKIDRNNPSKQLRERPILGLVIITGLEYKDGKWVNGTLYSPKKGMLANIEFSIRPDGNLDTTVSKSIFTSTHTWTHL